MKQLNAEHVYLYDGSGDAEICRVIDESMFYLCLLPEGITWEYNYYAYYVDQPMTTENVIVVVNNEEYEFGDTFEIAGHILEKFDSVANRSLYCFVN